MGFNFNLSVPARLIIIVVGIVIWKIATFKYAILLALFFILFGTSLFLIPTKDKLAKYLGLFFFQFP